MTRSTVEDIEDLFEPDDAADAQGTPFLRQALSAVIVGRGLKEARARFATLLEKPLAARPDNRLREMTVRQATADILGMDSGHSPTVAELGAGIDEIRGVRGMWQTLLENGAALALRTGQTKWAKKALAERLETPESKSNIWLTLLLHAQQANGVDVQSLPELGFFAVTSAWDATIETVPSLLALAAVHGPEAFGEKLHKEGAAWDRACAKVERGEPSWSVNADGVALTVTIKGKGSLRRAAPWALEDLVYRFAQRVDDLMSERVPAGEIAGPKKRARRLAIESATEQGIRAVAVLEGGATLAEEDRAALEARQDAGLDWVRARYSGLSGLRGKLVLAG